MVPAHEAERGLRLTTLSYGVILILTIAIPLQEGPRDWKDGSSVGPLLGTAGTKNMKIKLTKHSV